MTTQPKKDVYGVVTDHIISKMETAMIPWRVSWAASGIPTNLLSRKPYRGINVILLAMYRFESKFFLTEDQVNNLGETPKQNQWPVLCTNMEWMEKQTKDAEEKPDAKQAVLKFHKVYNVTQLDEESVYDLTTPPENPIEACKQIFRGMKDTPVFLNDEPAPYYDITIDTLSMPTADDYKNAEGYYYDLFRMLIHSTGHASRLDRKEALEHEPAFSREMLIADIGAHYLCFHAGITEVPLPNSLAVIHGWIAKFLDDPRLIVFAATQAQKAVDYILNVNQDIKPTQDDAAESTNEPWDEGGTE